MSERPQVKVLRAVSEGLGYFLARFCICRAMLISSTHCDFHQRALVSPLDRISMRLFHTVSAIGLTPSKNNTPGAGTFADTGTQMFTSAHRFMRELTPG